MNELPKTLNDPYLWVSAASALAAWIAAGIAWWIARATRKSLRLAEQQEQRRRPNLVLYLADGYSKFEKDSRLLAFSISVSNPTDTDNSIAQVELQVNYTTSKSMCMAVKIPNDGKLASQFGDQGLTVLLPPIRIDAHQTIAGWVLFELNEVLFVDCKVDSYTLLFQDSHGVMVKLEHAIIRELADEEAKGND